MPIYLLDNSLRVDVCYDPGDSDFQDNICLQIIEDCPPAEKVFIHDETNLYLTAAEALQLAEALRQAAGQSGSI